MMDNFREAPAGDIAAVLYQEQQIQNCLKEQRRLLFNLQCSCKHQYLLEVPERERYENSPAYRMCLGCWLEEQAPFKVLTDGYRPQGLQVQVEVVRMEVLEERRLSSGDYPVIRLGDWELEQVQRGTQLQKD